MDPDEDDERNSPCECCGEWHPIGAMEDGFCPDCADQLDEINDAQLGMVDVDPDEGEAS